MLKLYWSIGEEIIGQQQRAGWGEGVIDQLSRDLRISFPDMKGFSPRNLRYMKKWYGFYNEGDTKLHQLGAEIQKGFFTLPWRQHIEILTSCKNLDEAIFYISRSVENSWSRSVLMNMIHAGLYRSRSKAITNFSASLPAPQSDLAQEITKDPYNFDFLTLTEGYTERELENALASNITRFLLELGSGFSYVGRQVRMEVGDTEVFIDLLFYHLKLRCYVVVELKTGKLLPDHIGQLGVYVAAVNHQLRHPSDGPTIGLLICRTKNEVMARYALESSSQPIGISEYELAELMPKDFKSSLPSIEEIESELKEELQSSEE